MGFRELLIFEDNRVPTHASAKGSDSCFLAPTFLN